MCCYIHVCDVIIDSELLENPHCIGSILEVNSMNIHNLPGQNLISSHQLTIKINFS